MEYLDTKSRLLLNVGRWYACTLFGDDMVGYDEVTGGYSFTPILVLGLIPLKTGKSVFKLEFFHFNYPSGVQTKKYKVEKIGHGRSFLLARSLDHSDQGRFLLVKEITRNRVLMHFKERELPLSLRYQLSISLSEKEVSAAQDELRAWGVYN